MRQGMEEGRQEQEAAEEVEGRPCGEGGDHFDRLHDAVLLDVLNRIGDVKALGRCALVSRRFHALVPLVDSVFVRVDAVSRRAEPQPASLVAAHGAEAPELAAPELAAPSPSAGELGAAAARRRASSAAVASSAPPRCGRAPRGRARRGGAAAAAGAAMGERGRDAREQRTEAGPTPRRR